MITEADGPAVGSGAGLDKAEESPLSATVRASEGSIRELEKRMDLLEERLAPVVVSRPSVSRADVNVVASEDGSPIVMTLRGQRERIETVSVRLMSLMTALEV